ncbi:alpha/beta hydrolase family protein [Nocardiopsis nanhaiensis]
MPFIHRPRTAVVTAPAVCAVFALLASTAAAAPQRTDGPGHAEDWRGAPYSVAEIAGVPGLPGAERDLLVTYGSTGASGERITASGTVAVPPGKPPEGGWPVVGWAHGTTGVSDLCAPSAQFPDGPAYEYASMADETLDQWIERGYAVVRADFEGLGTPGGHPYLNGPSAANTVADLVTAAQRIDENVGEDWVALGHSQGGHGVLYTADGTQPGVQASENQPLGVVSAAPGGVGVSELVAFFEEADPDDERTREALPFLPLLLLGAAAAEPGLAPEEYLTEGAQPVLSAARTGCMDDIREAAEGISADAIFREDAQTDDLESYFRSQEPDDLELEVPTLFVQGTEDVLVPPAETEWLAETLADRATADVDYRAYEGEDHRGVLAASFEDTVEFADRLHAGR